MTEFRDITAPPAGGGGKEVSPGDRRAPRRSGRVFVLHFAPCARHARRERRLGSATLTSLAPYQPIFVAVTIGFLAAGFYLVYRRPKAAVPEGAYCARPVSDRFVKIALWGAALLVAAASAFPYAAPYLLDA